MRNRTNSWLVAALAGLLLLGSGAPLEAGPPERQEGPSPEVRQEYRERMRALKEDFRGRLQSLKAEYRARRQALRAEFQARHGVREQEGTLAPGPRTPAP